MPLIQSNTEQAFGENVKREMTEGHMPQKQAVAVAYEIQRANDGESIPASLSLAEINRANEKHHAIYADDSCTGVDD